MAWKDTLKRMVDGYKSQISGLQSQINQLRLKAQDLQEQAEALAEVMRIQTDNMNGVLNSKLGEFQTNLQGTCTLHFGKGYGTNNLTNWNIFYHGDGPSVQGTKASIPAFNIFAGVNNVFSFTVGTNSAQTGIIPSPPVAYQADTLAAWFNNNTRGLTFEATADKKINIKCTKSFSINAITNSVYATVGWSVGTYQSEEPRIVYQYGKAGWDGDSTITCLLNEFGFMLDYLHVDINIGPYGINDMLNLINNGIDKLEDMIHKFEIAKRRLENFINSGVSGCLINPSGGDL